eukprot:scaffold3677_cov206-Amphora_coffeaeformis.AAC.3
MVATTTETPTAYTTIPNTNSCTNDEETPHFWSISRWRFFLREAGYHVWHWGKLWTPPLWRQVAAWKQLSNNDSKDSSTVRWRRVVWGLVFPPLVLHSVNMLGGGSHTFPQNWLGRRLLMSPRDILAIAATPPRQPTTTTTTTLVAATTITTTYLAVNGYNLWKATAVWRQVWVLLVRDVLGKWRSVTTPAARALFATLQQQGRVESSLYYDMYLPSVETDGFHSTNDHHKAILLLPGAGVGHRAYAYAAHRLAEAHGYTVVVASAEPTRHLTPALGYDAATLHRTCLEPVQRTMQQRPHPKQITEWILVGHSMGAFATTHIVHELQAMMTDISIHTIVMWGVAPFVSAMQDLSTVSTITTTTQSPLHVAVIQGRDDAIIIWMRDTYGDLSPQFWSKLPQAAREYVIVPGTHSGFAHYESSMFPETNSPADRIRQQDQAVQLTHKFIVECSSSSTTAK